MRMPLWATWVAGSALGVVVAGTACAAPANIAFVSLRSGDPQIYTRDANGAVRAVTEGQSIPGQPALSSDDRVAFTARVGQSLRIFVTGPGGGPARRLTDAERMETAPSWSPDGRAVAYFSKPLTDGPTELRLTEPATGRTLTLASDRNEMGPTPVSWSQDGQLLVFSATYGRDVAHAWLVRRDGSGLRNLSDKAVTRGVVWPAISPDGRKVVWVADKRERKPVMVADVETGEAVELTPEKDAACESPRWSPDGRHIAFASTRDSAGGLPQNDIFVMNADGTGVRNLSRHGGEDFDPKWSADGRSIVFASLRSGTSQLFEVDLFNAAVRALSMHSSHDMDHVLRPVAAAK